MSNESDYLKLERVRRNGEVVRYCMIAIAWVACIRIIADAAIAIARMP